MSTMASLINSLTIVYSTVYSDTDQRSHQSSASLSFVRAYHQWPVTSPHKGPVTWKMFPFDDIIMHIPLFVVLAFKTEVIIRIKSVLVCYSYYFKSHNMSIMISQFTGYSTVNSIAFFRLRTKTSYKLCISFYYPRPVMAFGYCRCLRLSVCVCVYVCVCVRQSSVCPDDNLSPAQATITKFGPEVQNTLIKIPIVFGVHWPWPSRSNWT